MSFKHHSGAALLLSLYANIMTINAFNLIQFNRDGNKNVLNWLHWNIGIYHGSCDSDSHITDDEKLTVEKLFNGHVTFLQTAKHRDSMFLLVSTTSFYTSGSQTFSAWPPFCRKNIFKCQSFGVRNKPGHQFTVWDFVVTRRIHGFYLLLSSRAARVWCSCLSSLK